MKRREKMLVVKDWFHEKKMNEKRRNVQCTKVFAILKETEKAYNVLVGDPVCTMTYWVPKSCTEEVESNELDFTLEDVDYNEAYAELKAHMAMFI